MMRLERLFDAKSANWHNETRRDMNSHHACITAVKRTCKVFIKCKVQLHDREQGTK